MGKKRSTIGVLYSPTSNWIAGAYYVQNIVLALMHCDDNLLPKIKVFTSTFEEYKEFETRTHYPYLEYRPIYSQKGRFFTFLRKSIKKITGYNIYIPGTYAEPWERVKFVYPANALSEIRDKRKALAWIPDFQEKYLPEFFTPQEILDRNNNQKSLIYAKIPVVFSSYDALKDFHKFHPQSKEIKSFVLQFAVTHPDFSKEDIIELRERFGITNNYLFCANQFWAHKNHLFLFKAFARAKKMGLDLQLVCSGKMHDYRNDEYQCQIMSYINKNRLEKDIILTGFIERTEQLCLMKNAYAVVQPSLFEGWSTVVEDAKCLNKFIFLSDLNVHREQNPTDVCFFNARDETDLVNKLLTVNPSFTKYDYSKDVKRFGESFLEIIKDF